MKRKTSIEAFKENQKALSERRFEVYRFIFENGPATIRGTFNGLKRPGLEINSISPRFIELVRLGVIEETGEIKCPDTGNTVLTFDVSGRVALPREKKTPLEALRSKIIKQKKRVFDETQKLKKLELEWEQKTNPKQTDNMEFDL